MAQPTDKMAMTRCEHEVSRFVHAIAHELQNPLSSVTMLLSILRGSGDAAVSPFDDHLERALAATERMRRLLRSMVDFVDVGTAQRPPCDVDCRAVVREVLADLDEEEARSIDVEGTDWPTIRGDPAELGRVFHNLLDNALRYCGDDEPAVRVSVRRRDGAWEFRVADRGPGIPADQHARVFEPLVRLHGHDEIPGSGLGLSMARKIVERHGGAIGLTSGPDRGTEVWFTWPVAEPPGPPEPD